MTRLLSFLLFALLVALPAAAQIVQPTQSISVQDTGTQCATAGTCAVWPLLNTSPSFTIQITGSFSGTLTFRGTADGFTYFDILATKVSTGVAATTTTTTGQFTFSNTGLLNVRVVGTTIMSGGANLTMTRGSASSRGGGSTGPTFGTLTTGDLLYASSATAVSGLADAAVGQVLASGGVGVAPAYTASPSITGTYTQTLTALTTTSTDGILASNGTNATVGATVQISPRLKWTGNGWDSDDAVTRPVRYFAEVLPTSAATVVGLWKLGYLDPISSAITYPMTVSNGGNVVALGSLQATNNVDFGGNLRGGFASTDIVYAKATATITSGFSTTTPSIAGTASAFAVTIAATPGVTGTVAFNATFTNIPMCAATNTITANAVQAVPTTTTVVLNGVWVANDVIRVICLGY